MTGLRLTASDKGGQLCLGFQWDTASWESVPGLWESLFAWLDQRHAFWNLPALPAGLAARKRSALVKPLLARIRPGADSVTAMGFSGASHRLLNIDELDREVGWGLRNPWGTGISEVLGVKPRTLVPRVADLDREDVWKAYRDHGFGLIGIIPEPARHRPAAPQGCLEMLVVRVAAWDGTAARSRGLRLAASRAAVSPGGARLLLDLSGLSDPGPLEEILGPAGIFFGRAPALSALPEADGELPPRPASAQRLQLASDPFTLPSLHAALESTAVLSRKRRKKNEEFGALLEELASPGMARASEQIGPSRKTAQRLVAHMLGEVTLAGTAFDVRLRGGRFCGIMRQGADILPNRPARSFFRAGRNVRTLRTVSSVSFESDHGTGLREELRLDDGKPLDGKPLIVRIEYSFLDDSPSLVIGLDMDFPEFPAGLQVEEYAPLALALRTLRRNESATVEAFAPDGSASSVTVSEQAGGVLVPGAQHRVRRTDGGWIVLEFSQAGGRAWGLPSFRVCKIGRDRVLEVNLFGSGVPLPAKALQGRHIRFSVTLGLD